MQSLAMKSEYGKFIHTHIHHFCLCFSVYILLVERNFILGFECPLICMRAWGGLCEVHESAA